MRGTIAEQILSVHLVEAGARVRESGCLGCIGMGQAPGDRHGVAAHLPAELQGPKRHQRRPGISLLPRDGSEDIAVLVGGRQIMTRLEISDRQRRILAAGGILNLAKQQK